MGRGASQGLKEIEVGGKVAKAGVGRERMCEIWRIGGSTGVCVVVSVSAIAS